MSKLSMSLDDLISADRGEKKGGKGRGGGAVRNGGRGGRERSTPYSRPAKGGNKAMADDSGLERRGRGNFQYGKGNGGTYSAGKGFGGGGGGTPSSESVYVANLPWSMQWKDLKDHMKAAGEVSRVDIATKPDGRSRGFAIVNFVSAKGAKQAIKMFNETEMEGRTIYVREDDGSRVIGKGKGRGGGGGGGDEEPDDGYSHSGRTGRNGWVKPEGGDSFVDDGPPPEPTRSFLR